jgi:hypothetical protein
VTFPLFLWISLAFIPAFIRNSCLLLYVPRFLLLGSVLLVLFCYALCITSVSFFVESRNSPAMLICVSAAYGMLLIAQDSIPGQSSP